MGYPSKVTGRLWRVSPVKSEFPLDLTSQPPFLFMEYGVSMVGGGVCSGKGWGVAMQVVSK